MDKKTLVCKIDMFDLNQQIYELSAEGSKIVATVPTEEVGTAISNLSFNLNIENVHLFGSEHFLDDVVDTIQTCAMFNKNKVKVEVN